MMYIQVYVLTAWYKITCCNITFTVAVNCFISHFQIMLLFNINKANLRDLIAATGLVILLKLDSNRRFFSPCDLEIWWMTQKAIGHLFYAT